MGARAWSLLLLVVGAGCKGEPPDSTPDEPDFSCDAMPDEHCDHPIDRILIPKLRALDVPIRDATSEELCRRMAIDLLGRGPTPAEVTACASQDPGAMFDAFTAKPDYLREMRRTWGELFKYDNSNVWGEEIKDLDHRVQQVYAGEVDYAEFATQVAMHPALEALHPDDSWTTYVWNLFLGRPARQDEIDSMRPFTAAWVARAECDGAVWWNFYKIGLSEGMSEAAATQRGNEACYNVAKVEWGFNACRCQPGFFSAGCVSDALGKRVEVPAALCANPNDFNDPANFYRTTTRTPGTSTLCPDNVTNRSECGDKILDYTAQYTFLPFYAWNPPPATIENAIRSVGDALVARGDFWETGADRELRKLLGWWQATFRHPDSDLPAVRTVLADELKRTGSLKAVQRLIATSLLYAQPAAAPEVEKVADMAPWVAGPTKLLAGEAWLSTAATGVGETAGRCDFRWVSTGYFAPHWSDPRDVDPSTGTLDASPFYNGYSIGSIVKLAGCNSDSRRPEVSNIGLTFNQADLARTLCAYGRGVTPSGWTSDYAAEATHLIKNLWHRAPVAGEAEKMAIEMTGCVSAGMTTGCKDADAAARWMCQRIIDSAEFATY